VLIRERPIDGRLVRLRYVNKWQETSMREALGVGEEKLRTMSREALEWLHGYLAAKAWKNAAGSATGESVAVVGERGLG